MALADFPDDILIIILSKLPLKQAVCCSVLAKRWKFLWTSLPNLKFSSINLSVSSYSYIVDPIFEHHSGSLKEIINEENTLYVSRVEVPTFIFLCKNLRSLSLKRYILRNIPNSFVGFTGLEALNFENIVLNDNIIELMLQLCPDLKILRIFNCHGLNLLNICSDNLISLNISSRIKGITAKCPRLVNLVLIKKFGNLFQTELDLPACLSLCTDAAQFRLFTPLKSLRKITLVDMIHKHDVPILWEFPNLEQMCIDNAGGELKWSDIVIPDSSLGNLKLVHLDMTVFYDPAPLLACLLPRAPALESVLFSSKKGFFQREFVNAVLNQQLYTRINIGFYNPLKGRRYCIIPGYMETRCPNCDL